MNILYLINYAGNGGSEKYVLTLASNLTADFKLHFIYNISGQLVSEMERLGAEISQICIRHPLDFSAAVKLASYIRTHSIDIVHAQYPRENYIALFAKILCPHVKVIYTAHLNQQDTAIRKLLNRVLTRGNSAVIAVGTLCAELAASNGYPSSRVYKVFPGISVNNSALDISLPTDIAIEENCFVFTTICRLSKEKGLDFLINSIARLRTLTNKHFVLLIAGDGSIRDELKNLASDLKVSNIVILLGHRDDCDAILNRTDVYINSSNSESFGFATLEAMSHSLPVIATDIGGNKDIVNDETDCGIRVKYGDTAEMSETMYKLMCDEEIRSHFAKNSKKAVTTLFSENRFVQQTISIYNSSTKENRL